MFQKILTLMFVGIVATACDQTEKTSTTDVREVFTAYSADLIEEYWTVYPGSALYNGYYKYDDHLRVPDQEFRDAEREFLSRRLEGLSQFDASTLSPAEASDLAILSNRMERMLWTNDVLKPGEWNPTRYNVAGGFGLILNTKYKPLDERLRVIFKRLDNVPAYYEAARANIKKPTAEHTALAIRQNKGALGVFRALIPGRLAMSTLSQDEQAAFEPKLVSAAVAIEDYGQWLEALSPNLDDGTARDFRLGEELYEQKFALEIVSGLTGEELYEQALQDKRNLQTDMAALSRDLWVKYFPGKQFPDDELSGIRKVIDHLALNHIERESFIDEIRRQMPVINQFIIDNDLIEMDPTRPLVVRETPEYQRRYAGASVNSPGPYDATANTYYNVTPLDHFTAEEAESYLREYNDWTLQILNIHEALPGHYTQLLHANKSPSLVKSLFGNGAMIEGWGNYAERMMLESGYGNDEPEMWLMYYKWYMRVVVNTIIDYSIHVQGMSQSDVMDMLINEAFQEETEATGKWHRATTSQVQLASYYSGYKGIYALREEMKEKLGDQFDLRKFHDQFLSYGSAPVPVIRSLMLEE